MNEELKVEIEKLEEALNEVAEGISEAKEEIAKDALEVEVIARTPDEQLLRDLAVEVARISEVVTKLIEKVGV